MREVTVEGPGGRTLAVIDAGAPDGAPVVVHHGTPGSAKLRPGWNEAASERGLRLISYDRAGYGRSTRDPGRSVADVARDMEAIADALRIGRFVTWGGSGGGPHALATAALLGDRVAAAATVAGAAPADAGDLDFLAGMGEENVQEFSAAMSGEAVLRPLLEAWRPAMLEGTTEALLASMKTLLSPPDVAVITAGLAEHLIASTARGLADGVDGWLDDDLAFVKPWGFDPAAITVPVQVWQGEQDLMVPPAHGRWLASHLTGADAHISPTDGHLTLTEVHLGEIHEWLVARL
ncbi:alpha/beta fold hydrolase [Solirubrobacter soli]|uniref:alpha/beta fold hydrolase n=1 Tax=Solirubrobacter soli TaxID=363832 RepID=UPI000414D74A|nr:alpha/beta fold hydrolase [Solirubrobacter soli]